MRSNTFIFILAITSLLWLGCSGGPEMPGGKMNYFKGDYEAAVKEAAAQNKPIFIFGYTSWCAYCTKMNKTTLADKEVADYMNEHFINLSYDLEKDEGFYIKNRFALDVFPAYVFLDTTGTLISKEFGYMKKEKFMQVVKKP